MKNKVDWLTWVGSVKFTGAHITHPVGIQQGLCHGDSKSSMTEPELVLELAPTKSLENKQVAMKKLVIDGTSNKNVMRK